MAICNKLFQSLFLSILLYSSEVWGTYYRTDAKKWEKDPIKTIHAQFYKHFIGLDERATNIISRTSDYHLNLTSISTS